MTKSGCWILSSYSYSCKHVNNKMTTHVLQVGMMKRVHILHDSCMHAWIYTLTCPTVFTNTFLQMQTTKLTIMYTTCMEHFPLMLPDPLPNTFKYIFHVTFASCLFGTSSTNWQIRDEYARNKSKTSQVKLFLSLASLSAHKF